MPTRHRQPQDPRAGERLRLPDAAAEIASVLMKIGRNDPCPSGRPIKFKKCLANHPQLRTGASPADVWWVCDQWAAPRPPAWELLDCLREVATGFMRLDIDSYDPDALRHLEDRLLAMGLEDEALELSEHFLPVMQADGGLMPYAVPELAPACAHRGEDTESFSGAAPAHRRRHRTKSGS